MKIKKYVARDFQSALQLAKQEMGPDAIILQTRQVKPRGFRGWFSPPQVEITVAVDDTLQVNTDKARQSTAKPVEPEGAAAKPAVMMTDPGAELGLMQEMAAPEQDPAGLPSLDPDGSERDRENIP